MKTDKQINQAAEDLGWKIIAPNIFWRGPYFGKMNAARLALAKKGLSPDSEVYVASVDADAIFDPEAKPSTPPAVCGVLAWRAAELLAHGSHRLATEEEIERFHVEQKQRDAACAAVTALARGQGSVRHTSAFVEASKKLAIGG